MKTIQSTEIGELWLQYYNEVMSEKPDEKDHWLEFKYFIDWVCRTKYETT